MDKLPISVIVLTYNEEKNIRDCLENVYNWTGEIFIVDSFSTDKTIEIAKRYTDKIFQHPFENYAQQRNWAQENLPISYEWVFHLDADEYVTEELKEELRKLFKKDLSNIDGFLIKRKTIFMGRWVKYGGHYPSYHLRIFKKQKGRCEERLYDQHFIVKGKIQRLKNDIINTIGEDINLWVQRHNLWSTYEAEEYLKGKNRKLQVKENLFNSFIEKKRWLRNRVYNRLPLFLRVFLYFFYRYFLRLGFLDGKEGLIFHFLQGFWYRLLVDIKIYKIKRFDLKWK